MSPLSIRRALLALTVLLCGGIGDQSSAQQQAFTIVTNSGLSSAQLAAAIAVTPSTSVVPVAQAMTARAAGNRVLLLSGFADDLTSLDTVIVASKSSVLRSVSSRASASYAAPWLDNGLAKARQRASAWVASYVRANGPAPDLVVIRCRATMAASNYLPRVTPAGWAAVVADHRFAAVASAIGVADLRTTMYSSASTRAAWDAYFNRFLDSSIQTSLGAPFSLAYPNAVVCTEDRYAAIPQLSTIVARSGYPSSAQQVPFSLASTPAIGFGSVGAIVADLRRIGTAASLIPTMNAPGSAQWRNGVGALPAALQAEVARHIAAIGIRYAWSAAAGWNSADGATVLAAVRDANAVLGTNAPVASASSPSFDSARIFVSGSSRAGVATWRISMVDGIEAVQATFADGSIRSITRESGSLGAWLSHPEATKLVSVQPVSPAASTPEFVLLSDDVPAVAGTGMPARAYMIIYQGVDPQSYTSGVIDTARVVAAVGQEIAAGRGSEWGVLDFEFPFSEIMDRGPSDPRFSSAMSSLVATLRAVKSAYPAIDWTYYDFPRVPYWIENRDWHAQSAQERIALQDSIITKYAPLMDELDWFLPSIYDRYERGKFGPEMLALISLSETSFREASMGFIKAYMSQPGKVRRPIIPIASPWFIEGGLATQYRPIPAAEMIADQLRPAIQAGADGIALWCSTGWLVTLATRSSAELPAYVLEDQARVREQFKIDLMGATPSSFDWTSTESAALVRGRLADVVSGAVAAVNQAYSERASSSSSTSSGASLVSR